jgi:hypothetical protein
MHSDPQISLHEMVSPFRVSHGGRIHRCCTAQFIRSTLRDKMREQTNNATRQDRPGASALIQAVVSRNESDSRRHALTRKADAKWDPHLLTFAPSALECDASSRRF